MSRFRTRRGIVFLISISAMAVMMITGMTFMGMSMQQLNDAKRDIFALHALAMADAGINYVIWNQKYPEQSNMKIANDQLLPADTSLSELDPDVPSNAILLSPTGEWGGSDTFAAWLVKYTLPGSPLGTVDGYQAVARGHYRGYTRTLRALLRTPSTIVVSDPTVNPPHSPVLQYALFSGTNLSVGGTTDITGDVGCNGDLTIQGNSANVVGNAFYFGSLSDNHGSITGTKEKMSQQIILTDVINLANLLAYAAYTGGEVYNSSKSFWGYETVENRVIYVKGNVTINNNTLFSGLVTIVAEGDVTINGNTASLGSPSTSNLVIISPGTVKVNGNADIYATIIAPGVEAQFSGVGTGDIIGGVIGNIVKANGAFDIEYRRLNPNAVVSPPPPIVTTDDSLAWTVASWEQVQ